MLGALLRPVAATGEEAAPNERPAQVRRQPRDGVKTFAPVLVEAGDGLEEGFRVGVPHRIEEVAGAGALDDLAGVHDHYPVRAGSDDAHVVGDEQDGHVKALAQLVDEVEDLGLDGDVQGRRWLVGDQQFGLAGQGHGDHHALAQPT